MCETIDKTQITPAGRLKAILTEFGAPKEAARGIAKRAGAVIGPGGISAEDIRQRIINNLQHDGKTAWPQVEFELGEAASRVYQGKKPFPNKF